MDHNDHKTIDDGHPSNKNSNDNDNKNHNNHGNNGIINRTLWKPRPPLPAELELKSCILYIHREPGDQGEYIRWGQITKFDKDLYACYNDTLICTRWIEPSNVEHMERCSYIIHDNVEHLAIFKDILLWGLTLRAGGSCFFFIISHLIVILAIFDISSYHIIISLVFFHLLEGGGILPIIIT